MPRYIDAEKIRYCWMYDEDGTEHDGVTLQSIVAKIPTEDVVKVVRCGECIHRTSGRMICQGRPKDFYCGDGERR